MDPELNNVYAPLTEEQNLKVNELTAKTAEIVMPPTFAKAIAANHKLFLTMFLVARDWVVADTLEMITAAAAWRHEQGIGTKPIFPPVQEIRGYPLAELEELEGLGSRPSNQYIDEVAPAIRQTASSCWHKWDKGGRPVLIERTGKVKTHDLVKITTAMAPPGGDVSKPIKELHLHQNEVGGAVLRYQAHHAKLRGEVPPAQVCVIMDCTGLGMAAFYKPALDLLKANSEMDKAYYAEGLHRLYVVNTPAVIKVFWAVCKLWTNERMKKKIVFLKPHETAAGLLADIDAEHLPEFLGGTCKCDNECVPDIGEGEVDNSLAATEEFTVKAGGISTRIIALAEGDTAAWEYIVVAKEVTFSAVFAPASGAEIVVDAPLKSTKGDDSFVAPSAGVVTLTFDNKASWMTSKVLRLRKRLVHANSEEIETVEATDAEKADAAAAAAAE